MAWSQSIFLQALGWATLNSFWQIGLLWCAFQLTTYFGKPGSNRKYQQAVLSLSAGAAWFAWTFFSYYANGQSEAASFLSQPLIASGQLLPMILTAASVTYLILLFVPAVNVFRNWRYLRTIRTTGLGKAPVKYRLFVEKIAAHIGIRKTVRVYLSNLVTSPVTIGYLKPLILIPVAALNNLTPAQLEAVLLHELSHIRRYDYLVNLFLTALNVVLYFNPFVRLFLRAVETERENCCDELVLQFEYDKVSYASALLELEKSNHREAVLAMAATQRNNLLGRIEKIVGIQKKPRFNAQHLMGAFAALMFVFALNSLVIAVQEEKAGEAPVGSPVRSAAPVAAHVAVQQAHPQIANYLPPLPQPASAPDPAFKTVAYTEPAPQLNAAQQLNVQTAVDNARRLLEVQWTEVEKNIPDGLTGNEREMARKQYLTQVERVNWERLEQNLAAGYTKVDLSRINSQLNQQIALARLDSLQSVYQMALVQLQQVNVDKTCMKSSPMPDASVTELREMARELTRKIAEIDDIKGKKSKNGSVKL
jgi:bla regulator protein BlaR1